MKPLAYDLTRLTTAHREGSFATQQARRAVLKQAGENLSRDFKGLRGRGLKQKHIRRLVSDWKAEGLSTGTIKNRLAHLRWAATKMGRASVVPPNSELGVGQRTGIATESKALRISEGQLQQLDPHIRASVELQRDFGLRREEAIKFIPTYADKGDHLLLKGTWTKGGRPREVPIRTLEQRATLDRATAVADGGSLIPAGKNYKAQVALYEKQTSGQGGLHGLRHAYAQERYFELTGCVAPVLSGPDDSKPSRDTDLSARQEIALELGHNRPGITKQYLG